jgi:hypothetical protein
MPVLDPVTQATPSSGIARYKLMQSFSSALGAYIGGFVGWEESAATAHKTFENEVFFPRNRRFF